MQAFILMFVMRLLCLSISKYNICFEILFNQKRWKASELESWNFSFAPIPLRDFCVLYTRIQEAKQNIRSDTGQWCHCSQVDLIELKLK